MQDWLYAHAWRSLADLKRGGKVEPAFYTNPSLVDWLYRDATGRRAGSVAHSPPTPSASSMTTRPSASTAASAPTTSRSRWAAARPAATPRSSRRGAAAAPFPFVTKEVPA